MAPFVYPFTVDGMAEFKVLVQKTDLEKARDLIAAMPAPDDDEGPGKAGLGRFRHARRNGWYPAPHFRPTFRGPCYFAFFGFFLLDKAPFSSYIWDETGQTGTKQ